MALTRRLLIAGGIFNFVMGSLFLHGALLEFFFRGILWLEETVFRHPTLLPFPQNPVHLLLIHGFGAAALILGAMLVYSAKDPLRYLPFIFIDGLGRLLYGSLMLIFVLRYSLMKSILVFAVIELSFAIAYLIISWRLSER